MEILIGMIKMSLDQYIYNLENLGFKILNESRWLNAVTIKCQP